MTIEQKLIKEGLQEAQYIGEDGGMVVDGRFTELGAYRKMMKRWKEDTGEVEEFKEFCQPDDLSMGYLHLMTPEKREKIGAEEDVEWYVSWKDKSPYEVWVFWG